MNKWGVSGVITGILIILIASVAATILWAAIGPFASETSETSKAQNCLGTTFQIVSCSVNYSTGISTVSITRTKGSTKLDSIDFIFYGENGQIKLSRNTSLPKELETSTFSFTDPRIVAASKVDAAATLDKISCQPTGAPVSCRDPAQRLLPTSCADGVDNDQDGWTDAGDADCYNSGVYTPTNAEKFTALGTCSDGIDNNGDGVADAEDPSCIYQASSGGGGGGGGGGSSGSETTIVQTSGGGSSQCSDTLDNDGEGLVDYPNDPGCGDFADNNEGDEVPSNNFNFIFGNDGYIQEINWTNSTGSKTRIVWDEREPAGANPTVSRYGSAGVRYYAHSAVGDGGGIAWAYNIGLQNTRASDLNISHSKTLENSDTVVVVENDSVLFVRDTFRFYNNTLYQIINATNSLSLTLDNITLPVYLGGLIIGNYSASYQLNLTNPDISRLIPSAGGTIETNFNNTNSIPYSYPDINSFSPVSALWDSKITVGQQFLTPLFRPDYVEITHKAYSQFTPLIRNQVHISTLAPGESRIIVVAYTLSSGGNWKETLQPYKKWFIASNGGSEPYYCPTGTFTDLVGSNSNYLGIGTFYNTTTHRYLPGTNLTNMFNTNASRDVIKSLGFERFGLWETALNSACLIGDKNCSRTFIQECFDKGNIGLYPNCEFNSNIDLIDPNIDAGRNKTKIKEFTSLYALSNVSVFWYIRPCGEIYGANISFDANGNENFTAGVPSGYADVDLRNITNRDRNFQRVYALAEQGVRGFYYDAVGCPGDEAFFEYTKKNLTATFGSNFFFLSEGARDRAALRIPQLPLIKNPVYSYNSSVLIAFLVPHATYYGGIINNPLNYTNGEFDDILKKGYQAVPFSGPPTLSNIAEVIEGEKIGVRTCRYVNQSYANRYALWQAYGYNVTGCIAPPQQPPACPIS